jgi:hypothetical protein
MPLDATIPNNDALTQQEIRCYGPENSLKDFLDAAEYPTVASLHKQENPFPFGHLRDGRDAGPRGGERGRRTEHQPQKDRA